MAGSRDEGAEDLHEGILDAIASMGTMVVSADDDLRVTYWNKRAADFFGWTVTEAVGRDLVDLVVPAPGRDQARARLGTVVRDGAVLRRTTEAKNRDDEVSLVAFIAAPLRVGGMNGGVVGMGVDVTELRRAREELAASEARFRLLAESSPVGIYTGNRDEGCTFVNARLAELLDRDQADCLHWGWMDAVHPDDRAWVADVWDSHASKHSDILVHFRVVTPAGDLRYVAARLAPYADGAHGDEWVGTLEDVTEHHERTQLLARQALHDGLTGLPNRGLLGDRLSLALDRLRSTEDSVAVLFIDLDGFKAVNDTHGHAVGDSVLAEVAARIRGAVRPTDTVARLGGDEFVVLCEHINGPAAAEVVADRIRSSIEEPFNFPTATVLLTASIGYSTSATRLSPDELLHAADAAMYRNKRRT